MFETNIQNNSSLISLAKAAEITGYHQDYLGQLCRLGRLPAKKVGRNWFTSQDALQTLKTSAETPEQEEVREVAEVIKDLRAQQEAQPQMAQTITISQVEGLPIAIRTVQTPVRSVNTVQSIATNMRIQALQKEVSELRQMLNRLMTEVSRHAELLQGREFTDIWHKHFQLQNKFASNFDFNADPTSNDLQPGEQPQFGGIPYIEHEKPRFALVTWITATAVMLAIAFLATAAATGTFWGKPEAVKTVYYHEQPKAFGPAVAGDSTEIPVNPASNMIQ